jgi:hypothetical protein
MSTNCHDHYIIRQEPTDCRYLRVYVNNRGDDKGLYSRLYCTFHHN